MSNNLINQITGETGYMIFMTKIINTSDKSIVIAYIREKGFKILKFNY